MLLPPSAEVPLLHGTRRDARWLESHLSAVWDRFFPDVPVVNLVEISWRRPWKTRLGLITLRQPSGTTLIGLNSLLSHPRVPEVLTTVTVAHELVHYSHGFGSPLPRLYRHPHQGGIVDRDLERRGLAALLIEYERWIDAHWFEFYEEQRAVTRGVPGSRRRARRETAELAFEAGAEPLRLDALAGRTAAS